MPKFCVSKDETSDPCQDITDDILFESIDNTKVKRPKLSDNDTALHTALNNTKSENKIYTMPINSTHRSA